MADLIKLALSHPLESVLAAVGIVLMASALWESSRTLKLAGGALFLAGASAVWWLKPPPPPAPPPERTIHIVNAAWESQGHPFNCTDPVRAACEGKMSCSAEIEANRLCGDPYADFKNMPVKWECRASGWPLVGDEATFYELKHENGLGNGRVLVTVDCSGV